MKQLFTTLVVSVLLWGSGAYAQFCTPTYTTGITDGDSIVSISVGTLVGNYPGDPAGYNDYTDSAFTELTAGQTYTATIVNNPSFQSGVSLYLDYDNDQVFDATTELAGSVLIPTGGTGTITFAIPANAVQDTIVMRMVQNFNSIPTDPCGNFAFGETEDYSIVILPPPADNIALQNILPFDPACDIFSGGAPVSVEFNNGGSNAADTIPFAYTIDFGTPVLDTLYAPTITSGQSAVFTFSTLAQLPLPQTFYTIQVWTTYPNDGISSDDTITVTLLTPNLVVAPFSEDFETFTVGSPGVLNNGWTSNNIAGSGFEWFVDEFGTPGFGTGPLDDHTVNGQIYMYTESNFPSATGDSSSLLTPCIDLDTAQAPRLSFWYHMVGGSMGDLDVYVIAGGSATNVLTLSGAQQTAQGDDWLEAIVDLTPYAGQIIQVEWRGRRGTGTASDMAIDDISIFSPAAVDLGATLAVSPVGQSCYSGSETIEV
ncbi:MAG: GEVED domain-containing protein, partial [Bacteroidota bacterium]